MPTLKDASRVTEGLVELAKQLHEELTEGDVEFERIVQLADDIGIRADALAQAFMEVNRKLASHLGENGASGGDSGDS